MCFTSSILTAHAQEGELIYDYAWYSGMSARDPASCCFATTSRAHPLHLWDACTGELRCSYRAFDDNDEVGLYMLRFPHPTAISHVMLVSRENA